MKKTTLYRIVLCVKINECNQQKPRDIVRGIEASSPELRLERLKRLTNVEFEAFQRISNRRLICEAYERGDVELHCHFVTGFGAACAAYFAEGERRGFNLRGKAKVI